MRKTIPKLLPPVDKRLIGNQADALVADSRTSPPLDLPLHGLEVPLDSVHAYSRGVLLGSTNFTAAEARKRRRKNRDRTRTEVNACSRASSKLNFFNSLESLRDPVVFAALIERARTCEWVVFAKRPFAGSGPAFSRLYRFPRNP